MQITNHFNAVVSFFKETDFSRPLLITVAAVVPLLVFYFAGGINIGIGMTIGVLLSSPADVSGSFKRRAYGVMISILFAVSASLVAGFAIQNTAVFLVLLAVLIFLFSYFSLYGFRASLISFGGLLAVVLSMVSLPSGESVLVHSLLIGAGGLWYLLLISAIHAFNPKRQAEELLSDACNLTAAYLRNRSQLVSETSNQQELFEKLSTVQTELISNHDTIRETLISRRRSSGKSNDGRKKLLIFMELVDLLELGVANPVNFKRTNELTAIHGNKIQLLQDWTFLMASQLEILGSRLRKRKKYTSNPELEDFAEKVRKEFEADSLQPVVHLQDMDLMSLYHFKEKQYQKLRSIERLLQDLEVRERIVINRKEAVKFIPAEDYNLKSLRDNFDFKSPIFRHSLRLTVIVLLGYGIGALLEVQNAYWILLTSIVIMRPGYGLTKDRSKQRLVGTLIGGAVAASIILITQNPVIYGLLAVISFVLAFSMFQKNYKGAAAFITINIVLVYGFINPNAFEVIQFRVLDTIIGAGLALLGNAFLWPLWEYKGITSVIADSLKANAEYLKEIENTYLQKDTPPGSYKLARKEAFLAVGNLSAAFQRMTQEPKSKQRSLGEFYETVTLTHELFSSAASLGSFIRTYKTTKASEHFSTVLRAIQDNLSIAIAELEGGPAEKDKLSEKGAEAEKLQEANLYFKRIYNDLLEQRKQELQAIGASGDSETRTKFQEAQLITDQLNWLLEISASLERQVSRSLKG